MCALPCFLQLIPDRFAQHFRGQIGQTIKLASRHGYTFDVQITKNLEKLVLDSGWKAFARAHNLRTGDFLVFKYDGNSELKVLIFGPSGCEKIQACNLKKNAAPGKDLVNKSARLSQDFICKISISPSFCNS